MVVERIPFSCPMDCFDACGLIATIDNGRITRIEGDPDHPLTRGHVCPKGKALLERHYHPRRLCYPLRRNGNGWTPVSWDAAIDEIAARFSETLIRHDSRAILHLSGSGYGGLSKTVDTLFFNCLGGATTPRGSLCWGAGIAAQTYDFGDVRGHDPQDLLHSKTILLWGRNPADTGRHLLPFLKEARENGTTVVLIDPIRTATARVADHHVAIRPGTDGALALGMARRIIETGRVDQSYIDAHVAGFEAFRKSVAAFTPDRVSAITGLAAPDLIRLADLYGESRPAAILIGYGLQRYRNGGNTVRSIDALGAITGAIGRSGGGVTYANRSISRYLGGPVAESATRVPDRRSFPVGKLAAFLESDPRPPIECACVVKTNPLVQAPEVQRTTAAFKAIPFKVVFDLFMTDTARHADLVIPATTIFEEADFVYTNMFSPYLQYSRRVVDPDEGMLGEYDVFGLLARRLGLAAYPRMDRENFFKAVLAPLMQAFDVDMERLKQAPFRIPGGEIPWRDGRFATPSGQYELYSRAAAADGHSPLPSFIPPEPAPADYPMRLITPHAGTSLHSQHFAFVEGPPILHLNPETMAETGLTQGEAARIATEKGSLRVRVKAHGGLDRSTAMIYEGWWHKNGAVNRLVGDDLSEMGEQAAYYETFCRVEAMPESSSGDPSPTGFQGLP